MKFKQTETRELVQESTNLVLGEMLENGEHDGLWTFSATAPVAPYNFTVELIETYEKVFVQVKEVNAGYTIMKKGAESQ